MHYTLALFWCSENFKELQKTDRPTSPALLPRKSTKLEERRTYKPVYYHGKDQSDTQKTKRHKHIYVQIQACVRVCVRAWSCFKPDYQDDNKDNTFSLYTRVISVINSRTAERGVVSKNTRFEAVQLNKRSTAISGQQSRESCYKQMANCPRGVASPRLIVLKKLYEQQKAVCVSDTVQNASNAAH
jgi:hypothetical protein